jgi:hypothetical protein
VSALGRHVLLRSYLRKYGSLEYCKAIPAQFADPPSTAAASPGCCATSSTAFPLKPPSQASAPETAAPDPPWRLPAPARPDPGLTWPSHGSPYRTRSSETGKPRHWVSLTVRTPSSVALAPSNRHRHRPRRSVRTRCR